MNPDGRYFCESCTTRYDEPGTCATCPDEPLLDLLDEDVLLMLREFDDARWRARAGQAFVAAFFSGIWLGWGFMLAPSVGAFYAVGCVGFAWIPLAFAVFMRVFPPAQKTPDMGQKH